MKVKSLQFGKAMSAALFVLLLSVVGTIHAHILCNSPNSLYYSNGTNEIEEIFIREEGDTLLFESFEEYAIGDKIASGAIAAGHDYWTTWNNSPNSSEDGVIVDYSNNKCGHMTYGNDQVLLLGGYESGSYDLEFDVLLPNGKNGYFNVLHNFNSSGSTWAIQVYLGAVNDGNNTTHSPGHGTIHAGSSNTADIPCVYDEWMHFRIRVDTDNDIAEFFYSSEITHPDEQSLCQWLWSLDSFGNFNAGRKLDAMNFYPPQNATNSEFYIDNISLINVSGETAPEITIISDSINETLGKNETRTFDITIENNGNSIGEWTGWVDFGEGDAGSQTTTSLEYYTYLISGYSIGSSTACTREIGIRLPAASYASAMGMRIVSAKYYIHTEYQSADYNYVFRIYGPGFNNQPGEILAEKTVHFASTETGTWKTITAYFDEPVYVTGQTVWATVQMEQAAGERPLTVGGCDNTTEQDGNWISTNGGNFVHYDFGSTNRAWLISVNCAGVGVPGTWATLDKSSGTIMSDSNDTITLTLNSAYLNPGDYSANIIINTNDENNSHIEIPISLNVDYELDETLDYTTYDWQTNASAITRTIAWPDGKVNFAFAHASNTSFSDRGTAIGTYDAVNDTWIPSGGKIENEKTGFGSIAKYGQNGIVVAAHTATKCGIYIIENKDNIAAGSIAPTCYLDLTHDPSYPNVMTSGSNRNIIHVVAKRWNDNKLYYFRSQNGGVTWDKKNVILPFTGSEYCTNWSANCCYWMETTEDNCLALVVNNAWSDGMVIYSYDDGETWQRKVFYQHPNPFGTFNNMFLYPRWTSCQWDSQHHLHVLYEYNGCMGNPGSGSYYPQIGGVAYWNESMPYNANGNTQSAIVGNLIPGQSFVMDSAYLRNDIHSSSWWNGTNASHEMWPEYIGYLPTLDDDGNCEDPYTTTQFHISNRSLHGNYNSGICSFPVLCMVPGTDNMVAVWSAMDENHTDFSGKYYYKLFARASFDGGNTWTEMKHLTNGNTFDYNEFVYNQAAIVDNKLVIASQTDYETGTFVQGDESNPYNCYYQGLVFNLDSLFGYNTIIETNLSADICQGEDYLENGFEIYYPEVGENEYSITLPSSQGLDSIVNLTLTVYPTYYIVEDTTLCNASSYTWHGNIYTQSGIYYDSLQTIHGCDSICALSLEFFNTPLGEFTYMTPTNNYLFTSLPITFNWDAVSGAEYYNLYLWNVYEPAPSTPYAGNIYNRSCYVPALQNHQTYNWYVEAVNTCFSTTSSVRSFSLNTPPSMSVNASSLNFGEVALNNSNTLNLYVSGNALDDTITMQLTGEDASMFSYVQGSNWNGLTGGLLSVTFSPMTVQYNYTANLVITTGTLTQTVQLTGSLADMFVFNTYVTQDVFEMNSTVPIYGTVMDANNNPASSAEVEVKVTVMNMTRSLFATTGADGHFSVDFVPAYSESGYYTINSGRVGHNSTAIHDDFNIPGMNLVSNDWILWDVVQNETTTGSIVIRNRSQIPLNNIQVTANTLPEGCSFTFQPLSLAGMEEGVLEYSVSGTIPTNGYQEVNLVATSSEGASMNFTVWYRCAEPRGILYASPNNITTTMTKGINKIVDVMLYNNGTGPTGSVYLDLPSVDWLSVVGNDTLPSIAVQDSAYFSLRLSANENTPLVQYTGNIAINCERGDGLLLPYSITAVSDSTGTLVVDVTDDYTYNGNGQHLAGATVTVKGYYSLQTVAIGLTGSDGTFTVENIPEGYYRMSVTAPRHAEYQATIQIEGGQTNTQNIYLQYQAITYSWNVVPTEIQDEYTFELIVEYETNVPVPVVVIDMPQTFPELAEGESFVFDYIISNLGLVDTYEATLYPPTNHPLYDFTPLVTEIDTLRAQTSVVIPCTMTVRNGQRSPLVYAALNGKGERDDDCPDMAETEVQSYYYCNGEKVYVTSYKYVQIGSHPCNTPPSGSGGGGGGGVPGGGGGGGGGGHYSGSGCSGTPPVMTQQQGCSEDPNLPGALQGAMGEMGGCPPPFDGTPKLPPIQPQNNRRNNN